MSQLYDVIIIGGGPAAVAAGVYVARKQLSSLLITESFGGQSIVSDDVQNWIGDQHISGIELAQRFEKHVRAYPEVLEIHDGERVTIVKAVACTADRICDFEVTTERATYQGKTVVVAAGARRRKLGIPGEEHYDGKGVVYCSTCDAPLFKGKTVVVVGAGNAGLEAVQDLFPYAAKIYLLVLGGEVKGDAVTFAEVKDNPKLNVIYHAKSKEVMGETLVTRLIYTDTKTGEDKRLDVGGVFVEIGSIPNSEIVQDLVDLDRYKQVIINSKTAATSHPGVFAAGDITDDPFKQNNISAGDGVKAALSAYSYILKHRKTSPAEEPGLSG